MKFLCGCTSEGKLAFGYPTGSRKDKEGFDTCPEHGDRVYGWKTKEDHRLGKLVKTYELR